MSEFKCEIVKIDSVEDHPNADRLSIVNIGGFRCISAKLNDGSHRYSDGELVVYIPEAAILPEWLLKKMGFWHDEKQCGTLSGAAGNRVKAIKLRNVVSQGVLYPVTKDYDGKHIISKPIDSEAQLHHVSLGDDVKDFLDIVKYEPPIPTHLSGVVGALHGYTLSYDIENLQKYKNIFTEDDHVVFTEKLHGSCFITGFLTNCPEDKQSETFEIVKDEVYAYVSSKGLASKGLTQKVIDDNAGNVYVQAFKNHFETNDAAKKQILKLIEENPNSNIHVYGEVFGRGIQDLHYGQNSPILNIFDVRIQNHDGTGRFLDMKDLMNFCISSELTLVPVLYMGKFSMTEAEKHRDGQTVAGKNQHIREGIVIRGVSESEPINCLPFNRKQLKFVSPDYLLRKGETTEYN